MLRTPQRLSLVAQTVAILKEHITSRSTGERLGSERELCQQLGVSRLTLRTALSTLVREGLVQSSRGKRRIIAGTREKNRESAAIRDVAVLSPVPLQAVEPRVLFWIDELRDVLARENFRLEFANNRGCFSRNPAKALEELSERLRPSVWLLYLSTQRMQEWFMQRGLPAVISGSRYEGVRLPSVDVDYRATCQHAVGRFLAKGHRSIALLNPQSIAAGDIESELGFQQAGAAAGAGVETLVAHHDGSVPGICAALDRLLKRPHRPTAFLISRPAHTLTALGHLLRRGLKFPRETALIARDHDSFLEHVVPSVARYQADPVLFAHKLSRVVQEFTSGGNARPLDHRIMPRLVPGETLG